jgi:hypothetical protein
MKKLILKYVGDFCKVCGRLCSNVGSGECIRGMCERCYENGGDDE